MKLVIVSVLDSGAQAYSVPQFVAHRGVALRSFRDACNDKSCPFGQHPEDYELYEIGWFDDQVGEVHCGVVELIVRGKDCVKE